MKLEKIILLDKEALNYNKTNPWLLKSWNPLLQIS